MKREEQMEVATIAYINGRLRNNVPPEEIEEIRLAYQAGFICADEHPDIYSVTRKAVERALKNLWHDAQGNDLPEIDKEVIVLCGNGYGGYKVCFGHRPDPKDWIGKPISYDKGGWNIPDVRWWLDVKLPNKEE